MNEINVAEIRKILGISQKILAERLGVHPRTIQNWEAGGEIPQSKRALLCSLLPNQHIVFGGQHVQNGDAVNGDKIVEQMRDEVQNEKITIQNMECSFDQLIATILRMQSTIDKLVEQQDRYLTIIENMQVK